MDSMMKIIEKRISIVPDEDIRSRAIVVDDVYIAVAHKRQKHIAKNMRHLAVDETRNPGWGDLSGLGKIYLMFNENEYIGYLACLEPPDAVLPTAGQLYIRKQMRRKGRASALMKFWIDKVGGVFCPQGPNDAARSLLRKMGYGLSMDDKYDWCLSRHALMR